MSTHREKKSERLEVRLSHSEKQAFTDACRENGLSPSQAVRQFIDAYIRQSRLSRIKAIAKEVTMIAKRNPAKSVSTLAATAAAVFFLTAAPSAANEAAFKVYDANEDGAITLGEIAQGADDEIIFFLDSDGSGGVTLNEFDTTVTIYSVGDFMIGASNLNQRRIVRVKQEIFDFSQGGFASSSRAASDDIAIDADQAAVDKMAAKLKRRLARKTRAPGKM
jgi:antitoxin component of RelBE/YafQ-DinJ toxin-antitoxin module